MTSNRNLAILVAVTAAMVVITAILYSGRVAGRQEFQPGSLLLQGVDPDKIHTISIVKGGEKVTLTREGKGFVLAERNNYPASIGKINELELACLESRVKSKVTDSKENHKDLGVAVGSNDATVVTFSDNDGKTLIGLVRGKDNESRLPYVRLLDKDTVYVGEGNLTITTQPVYYLDKKLIEVKSEDIRRVEVQAGADKYAITRDEKGTLALDKVPQGKRVKDSMRDTVLGALNSLEFTDVALAEKTPLDWDIVYTCELASKLVYTVKLAKKGDKHYVKVSASAPNIDSVQVGQGDTDKDLKKKDALLQGVERARDFTPRHAPWVYEVQAWTAEKMRHPLNDLVEDIPKDTTPEEIAASHVLIAYKGSERSTATRSKEEAKKRADEVLAKARAEGADFATLAKEYSDEPGANESGGDLKTFKKGAMAKPFEDAAFKLKVGEISDVVETQFGFHVIKRTK